MLKNPSTLSGFLVGGACLTFLIKYDTIAMDPTLKKHSTTYIQMNSAILSPDLQSISDSRLFLAARQIADMIFTLSKEYKATGKCDIDLFEDRRNESSNPFYNQTMQGLFLEFSYGLPSSIYTPWGKWRFRGSACLCGDTTAFNEDVIERLGATQFQAHENNSMGSFGPVYEIHRIEDYELPPPSMKSRGEYTSYEKCCELWGKLVKEYHDFRDEPAPMDIATAFALDDVILLERGKQEPTHCDHRITSLDDLKPHLGKVIKYSTDGGTKWHYAILHKESLTSFSDGSTGFCITSEVLPHTKVHSRLSITDQHFEAGILVRLTNNEEVKNIVFSYDRKPE